MVVVILFYTDEVLKRRFYKNGNKKIIKEEGNLHLLDLPNNKNLN